MTILSFPVGKMIFKYIYAIWIPEGSIVEVECVGSFKVHIGFYAFDIDMDKLLEEYPQDIVGAIDIDSIWHGDSEDGIPTIYRLKDGISLSLVPDHCVQRYKDLHEDISYQGELSVIHVDPNEIRNSERFFLSGNRHIRVFRDTIELVDTNAYPGKEFISLPQWMDKWSLSLYEYISFRSIPIDTTFDDDRRGLICRTTKALSIMYIDVNRFYSDHITEKNDSLEEVDILWKYEDLPNISYISTPYGRNTFFNVKDKVPHNQGTDTPIGNTYIGYISPDRSFQIGSHTVSVTPTQVRIYPTYATNNIYRNIPLNRISYKDITVKTG